MAISYIYEKTLYKATLKEEGWLKNIGDHSFAKKADILYFSASPNSAYSLADTDKRSIDQMIQDQLKGYTIESLDTGSIHGGVFLHALHQMPKDYKPKMIMVDMNLRSFGIRWLQSGLENSIQRNMSYWNNNLGIYNRINAALKNYAYIPYHERFEAVDYDDRFNRLPFKDSCSTIKKWVDSIGRIRAEGDVIGQEFVRFFGFQITKKNPMMAYYDQIVDFCDKNDIKLVFLILPENVEVMENKAGVNLKKLCYKNIQYLKNHYANSSVTIIDALDDLNASYFFETYPTEHYIATGRKIVADKVIKKLDF